MRTPGSGRPTFEFNHEDNEVRFRELLLYVVDKCCSDPKFGATKLNKILFYADFYSYARYGCPITGVEYMKLPQGPAPRRLRPIQDQLTANGELEVFERELWNGRKQRCFIARRKPQLQLFTAAELALVDEVIEHLRDMTAKEVSDGSHGRAWKIAGLKESIPYESVFISDRNVTEDDVDRAYELAAQYNWRERYESRRANAG